MALALGASVLWGFADFLGGLQTRRRPLLVVLLALQAVSLGPIAAAIAISGDPVPGGSAVAWALVAGGAGGLGLAALYRALAVGTMSLVAPVAAVGAAVPVLAGLADGERPGAIQLAGAALALGGVMIASREPVEPGAPPASRAALGLSALAAAGLGLALLGIGRASEAGGVPWALLLARLPQFLVLAAAVAVVRPPLPRGARDAAPLAVLGLVDIGANALFALATTEGLLSLVSVVGSIYPAFTVLLARLVLRERVTPLQDLGIVATLAGVAAISAG